MVLYIDQDRVTSPIRYDDPAEVFPHIYGPLNRDAILAVEDIGRAPDGTFLKPPDRRPVRRTHAQLRRNFLALGALAFMPRARLGQ